MVATSTKGVFAKVFETRLRVERGSWEGKLDAGPAELVGSRIPKSNYRAYNICQSPPVASNIYGAPAVKFHRLWSGHQIDSRAGLTSSTPSAPRRSDDQTTEDRGNFPHPHSPSSPRCYSRSRFLVPRGRDASSTQRRISAMPYLSHWAIACVGYMS